MMACRSEIVAFLLDVRALISQGWARGPAARDKAGRLVNWSCDSATNWSLIGAMFNTPVPNGDRLVYLVTKRLIELYLYPEIDFADPLRTQDLGTWNDSRTDKRQVLRMLDAVIKKVRCE